MRLRNRRNTKLYWLLLIVAYVVGIWFINANVDMHINSDDSSELILSHLLSVEEGILSPNWYYSTELRVLNTQLIYSFFFRFIDSWHMVRVVSIACMLILLIWSYLYFCRRSGMKNYSVLSAVILLLPFSTGYFLLVLKGAYYIPHILISFLTLALLESFLERKDFYKGMRLQVATVMVLAIGAGLGGLRQIVMLYLPLALAGFISFTFDLSAVYKKNPTNHNAKALWRGIPADSHRYTAAVFVTLVASLVGFALNTFVLAKYYTFMKWGEIHYASFEFDRLADVLHGFLDSLGFSIGNIFSSATISNFVCVGWVTATILAVTHGIRHRTSVAPPYYRLSLFFSSGILVYTGLYLFSNMEHSNRYNLPILIFSIPLIAMYIESISLEKHYKDAIAAFAVIMICISSVFIYCIYYRWDETSELRSITEILYEADYRNGYATFWNGNVLTELSDGQIEAWSWLPSGNDPANINELYTWLQKKSHMSEPPIKKTFLMFTQSELESSGWKDKLDVSRILYESNTYIVFGYNSYEEILTDLSYYTFDFQDNRWINNGADIDGVRELYRDGLSYGPYIVLYPGEHLVTIRGEKLDYAVVKAGYAGGQTILVGDIQKHTPEQIQIRVFIPEWINSFEVLISNSSDETVMLHSVTIERTN